MQTSALRYPKADRFVRIHASLQIACKGNACAAALITFFEGWHNYSQEYAQYRELYNQMLKDANQPPIIDTSGWQFHTNLQLEEGLLNLYKIDTINKAISFLEDELLFISTDVPDRLRILYKTGRTRWFLLMTDRINEWFARFEMRNATLILPPHVPKPKGILPSRKKDVVIDKSDSQAEKAATVFNYWRTYTKHPKAVMDVPRLKLIIARLQEGYSVERLCYAVEGNLVNPYHRGENDRNEVFDSVELIFRSASDVDRFCSYAKRFNVKADRVISRLADKKALDGISEPSERLPVSQITEKQYAARLSGSIVPHVLAFKTFSENDLKNYKPPIEDKLPFNESLVWKMVETAVEDKAGIFAEGHREVLTQFMKFIKERINQNG